jgi:circadian clock protein KaiB
MSKRTVYKRGRAAAPRHSHVLELRVYVANSESRSVATLNNLRSLCQQHVLGGYRIQVVDVRKNPERCAADQILAIPTVVRRFPLPERRVVGTLSETQLALAGLELERAN